MDSFLLRDLQRRLANLLRVGTVDTLDEAAARVRVKCGDILTAPLPWLTARAGPDATWWAPEPGEQVLVLAPSGELAQAVVLPAIYQEAHPAPGEPKTVHLEQYQDGAFKRYDREGHHYALDVPAEGSVTVHIGKTTLLLEDGKATVTTPELLVDSPKSTFTGEVIVQGLLSYLASMEGKGGASVEGTVAVSGGDVDADGTSLKTHKHPGDSGGMTGPPQ